MELGIYRRPPIDADTTEYTRLALYDFNAGEWAATSDGNIVSKASGNPSPEELKVRFDLDLDVRRTIVTTPADMQQTNRDVTISDPSKTVEEGHADRREHGGPLLTQTEAQYRRDQNVAVYPDDHEISDEQRAFHEERGETVVRESDWDGLNFAEEFDIQFPGTDVDADADHTSE